MTTTTDPTALLAEALWGINMAPPDVHRIAGEALRRSPTLARALAIGTAWLAAEAEAEAGIPKGRDDRLQGDALIQCGGYSWGDSAFFAETYRPAAWAHTRAATPEAALLALADALRKERGA